MSAGKPTLGTSDELNAPTLGAVVVVGTVGGGSRIGEEGASFEGFCAAAGGFVSDSLNSPLDLSLSVGTLTCLSIT